MKFANQSGATLIEVLITMLVVAVGLLGAAGMQLASTRYQQTSALRSQALLQAEFLVEKIRVNSVNLTAANLAVAQANPETAYLAADEYPAADALPADPACGLAAQPACTAAQAAQRDLRDWKLSLARDLPGGRGSVFPVTDGVSTEANARRVVVMWREKLEAATDNLANQDAPEVADPSCPGTVATRVPGVRCLNLWITP